MKNSVRLISLAALLVLSAACVRDLEYEVPQVRTVTRQYTTSFETPATRTAVSEPENGICKVSWTADDQILYYSSTDGETGSVSIEEDCDSATISMEIEEGAESVTAIYGASAITARTGDTFTVSGLVPSEQDGTFKNAHVSVARASADATEMQFKNVTGLLKFTVSDPVVHHVVFYGNNNETLTGAGGVKISFDTDGNPQSEYVGTEVGKTITVNTGNVTGDFYISLLPGTKFTKGFTFEFYDKNGYRIGEAATSKNPSISRTKITYIGEIVSHLSPTIQNLSDTIFGTANCYIVPEIDKYYKFRVNVKGNGVPHPTTAPTEGDLVLSPDNAYCLVAGRGSDDPISGFQMSDVIDNVVYHDGYVYFSSRGTGSALIVAENSSGTILWSWHIWVLPGYDPMGNAAHRHEYYNGAGVMMDRNLGAETTAPVDRVTYRDSWGFMYQWGRKDPIYTDMQTIDQLSARPTYVESTASIGTIDYATRNPRTYIYRASGLKTYDWMYVPDDTLWGDEKTIYDPCPPGWKVPTENFWKTAKGSESKFYANKTTNRYGLEFSGLFGDDEIWYPCAGYLAALASYNSTSRTWSRSSKTANAGNWTTGLSSNRPYGLSAIYQQGQAQAKALYYRDYALSVRCQLDGELPSVAVESISLDNTALSIEKYKTSQLTATLTPSYATDKTITWTSSNPYVATVTANGENTAIVEGVEVGTCTITATSSNGKKVTCSVTVEPSTMTDLSASGRVANSYIVSTPGNYAFRVDVAGNDLTQTLPVANAHILWESYGTDYFTYRDYVIKNGSYSDGKFYFSVPEDMVNGNVVVAAYDADSNIIWSWHLWVVKNFDPDSHSYDRDLYNNGDTVMDRNLGATSDQKGVASLGLHYQWGRKDPFPGPDGFTSSASISRAIIRYVNDSYSFEWPSAVACSESVGTVEWANAHPTTYISSNSNKDWLYTADDALWGRTKTLSDPCPYGWRVPNGGTDGLWVEAAGSTDTINMSYDSTYNGLEVTKFSGSTVWYPFAAYRSEGNGGLYGQGGYGVYMSCDYYNASGAKRYNGMASFAQTTNTIMPSSQFPRARAGSVRCVKE